jgi:hypothetical protein
MKNEIKVEVNNKELLENMINESYFKNGNNGKLVKPLSKTKVSYETDNVLYTFVKGLNNVVFKITNEELIDGSMRCIITSEKETIIEPISNFCIVDENKKYSFY